MKFVKSMLTCLAIVTLLTSCASSAPTRFYTLSAPAQSTQSLAKTAITAIEVLPVNVPERLKRPQLVVNTQGTQLKVLEQDRWSSPLNEELRDAFSSSLVTKLGAIDVARGGRVANQPVYRIAIALRQLDAIPDDKIQANFGWTITRLDPGSMAGKDRTISCQLAVTKTLGTGMDALVRGMQAAVADVVAAISANINSVDSNAAAECGG